MSVPRQGQSRALGLLPGILAALIGAGTITMAYEQYAHVQTIGADLSTYMLPGHAAGLGLGLPYVDYFDIKPPLVFALFVPWMRVVGTSLLGMWLLYGVLLVALLLAFWLLLRRVLRPWLALFLFTSTCVIVVGLGLLEDLFFVTEVVGLVLVLWGVLLAVRWGERSWALFAAGLMVASAGQIKEVFLLAPVVLVMPALAHRGGRWRGLLWTGLGVLSAWLVTLIVLIAWGRDVLPAYIEVLGFKAETFPRPTLVESVRLGVDLMATMHDPWIPLVPLFALASLAIAVWSLIAKRIPMPTWSEVWRSTSFAVAVLWLSLVVGLIWQARGMYGHYSLPLIFPTMLLVAAVLRLDLRCLAGRGSIPRIVVTGLLLVTLLPAVSSVAWVAGRLVSFNPADVVRAWGQLESPAATAMFRVVADATPLGGCVQVAYGWSASAYYLYSERRPCSRFIVPPLWTNDELRKELRAELITHPPSVLVLDNTVRREVGVAGKDENSIDREVFPYQAVARACYRQESGSPTVWLPVDGDRRMTSSCIERQLELAGLPAS